MAFLKAHMILLLRIRLGSVACLADTDAGISFQVLRPFTWLCNLSLQVLGQGCFCAGR